VTHPADRPLSISWSQLRTHMECRQKGHLLRAGKRSPAANIRGFYHGMVVDSIMRDWLADPHRRPGTMTGLVDDYITQGEKDAIARGSGVVRWKNADDRAVLRQFCIDLLTRLEPILDELVLPYQFFSALTFRVPVTVPYLDGTPTTVYLRGEMDLLVRETDGHWAVWDLKGTRDDQYWRKVLGQLLFYDLATLALHGQPTTRVGLIQPLCARPVLEWQLTDDHRRQIWAAVISMATDIWRTDVPCKSDTASCAFCEVRHACPRYDPVGNTMPIGEALRLAAKTGDTR